MNRSDPAAVSEPPNEATKADEETTSAASDADDLKARFRTAARAAKRWLTAAPAVSPLEEMQAIANETAQLADPSRWDRYAEAGPVEELEGEVARLLGKPAAAMFPSGVMAQQSTLRVWADTSGSDRIALPALSHLLHHELGGPQLLHGFRYEWLTAGAQVPVAADLGKIPGRLGAVLLELPLRDAGYLLPTWDELAEFSTACRARGVPLHFDGARIWESQAYLGRSLDEIAALADTVYVSFYKGLLGLSGAAVAGPEDVVDEVRQWRTRGGGTLYTMLPNAVAALRGLREQLPRMGEYHNRAVDLSAQLPEHGIRVWPTTPHTNAFRIFADQPTTQLNQRLVTFMEDEGIAVSPPWEPSDVPGWSWTEFTVGPASMEWTAEEIVDILSRAMVGEPT